jgi:hypothetical protein
MNPTLVWITDPGADGDTAPAPLVEATVEAALAARRNDDRVVIDQRLVSAGRRVPAGTETATSLVDAAIPPDAGWRILTLGPGVIMDRGSLDQLHSALRVDPDVVRVGPVLVAALRRDQCRGICR